MTATWTAPLNPDQRLTLAKVLANAVRSFDEAAAVSGKGRRSLAMLTGACDEMDVLHADVTGRAAVLR